MSKFKLDKGIPLPPARRDTHKYPFAQMEVDVSVFFPGAEQRHISGAAQSIGKSRGWRFATRKAVENGVVACGSGG